MVAAYRDKFECTHDKPGQFESYDRRMIDHLYRLKQPTDFFEYKNNYGSPWANKNCRKDSNRATFWEFAKYVIKHINFDGHWYPQAKSCKVCTVPYDKILHLEYLKEEEKYLVNFILMADRTKNPNQSIFAENSNPSANNLSSSEITQLYFQQLKESEILDLYQLYKEDFLLFGYTFSFGSVHLPL